MTSLQRPLAWQLLAQALRERRPVRACYHQSERLLCPHILGWRNGRAKMLAYQATGTTSRGPLPAAPAHRWRSMFIDEIDAPVLTDEPWQTADNYTPHAGNGLDLVEFRLPDLA